MARPSLSGFDTRAKPQVRRRSALQRAAAYPGDVWLRAAAAWEELDWEHIHRAFSFPVGAALNLAFLFTRSVDYVVAGAGTRVPPSPSPAATTGWIAGMLPDAVTTRLAVARSATDVAVITAAAAPAGAGESWAQWAVRALGLDKWTGTIQALLWAVCLVNMVYFFARSRRYHLTKVDERNPPRSRNVKRVPAGVQTPQWAERGLGRFLWTILLRRLYRWTQANEYGTPIWELHAWDISLFHQNLFCLFSPVQLYILQFVDFSILTLPVLALLPLMLLFIMHHHAQHQKDRQIIAGSMFHEYNVRLVHPRLFYPRADTSVGGEEVISDWFSTDVQSAAIAEESEDEGDPRDVAGFTGTSPNVRAGIAPGLEMLVAMDEQERQEQQQQHHSPAVTPARKSNPFQRRRTGR